MTSATTQSHLVEHLSEQLVQGLAANVEQALWRDDRLRSTDSLVTVVAEPDGAVTLTGHVRGDMLKLMAGRIAARVPGVTRVMNGLVADNELEADIAAALASDPAVRAYTDQTTVKVILGVAQLSGTLSGADAAAAEAARVQAEKVARAVPGVRELINHTRAVVGSAAATAAAGEPAEAGPSAGDEAQAAMQARLAVWRERQASR